MQITNLSNGIKLIYENTKTKSIAINVGVNLGSIYEEKEHRGISHFIEHVVFEGTENYENSKLISNEIEAVGGEINAYTSTERTCYHIKILNKYFDIALKVLSEIITKPLFRDKDIERERKIIMEEIKMGDDNPRSYRWDLFEETLFENSQLQVPIAGTINSVKLIKKEDLMNYYNIYYNPKNIVICVVGDLGSIDDVKDKVEKYFINFKNKKNIEKHDIISDNLMLKEEHIKDINVSIKEIKERIIKKDLKNSYVVLGFKTFERTHPVSFVLDIVKAILARGQSGKLFYEIRTKRGLAYEIGIYHETGKYYGFFAAHANTSKKNVDELKKIILNEIKKLNEITEKELEEAKKYIEGNYILEKEDTAEIADTITQYSLIGNENLFYNYLNEINKVTIEDVKKVVNEYLVNPVIIILEEN